MATETTSGSHDHSRMIRRSLERIRQSKPLQGIVFGVGLIGIGMMLQVGVVAGMMGIYGVSAILVSAVAHFAVIALRGNIA